MSSNIKKVILGHFLFLITLLVIWGIKVVHLLNSTIVPDDYEEGLISILGVDYVILELCLNVGLLLYIFKHYSSVAKESRYQNVLMGAYFIIMILFYYGIGSIIDGPIRNGTSLWYAKSVLLLVSNNQITPDLDQYHNWPVIILFFSMIVDFFNIEIISIIKYFEVIGRILIIPFLWNIFKEILSRKGDQKHTLKSKIFFAIWMFLTYQNLDRVYFNFSSIAFYLFLHSLYLGIKIYQDIKLKNDYSRKLVYMIFIDLIIILSHPYTSLLTILIKLPFGILLYLEKYRVKNFRKIILSRNFITKLLKGLLLSLIVVFLFFLWFNTSETAIKIFDSTISLDPNDILERFYPSITSANITNLILRYSTAVFLYIFPIIIFLLFSKQISNKMRAPKWKIKNSLLFLFATFSSVLITGYGANPQTYEIRSRIYIFSLIWIIHINMSLLYSLKNHIFINKRKGKNILTLIMIFFIIFGGSSTHTYIYYNAEKQANISDYELEALDYIRENYDVKTTLFYFSSTFDLLIEYPYYNLAPDFRSTNCSNEIFTEIIHFIIIMTENLFVIYEENPDYLSAFYNNPNTFISINESMQSCPFVNRVDINQEVFLYEK